MSTSAEIEKWVEKKPLILGRLDEFYSESLLNSRRGFEQLTIVKPHRTLDGFRLPTLAILEIQEGNGPSAHLATVVKKTVVSTFESRLTIKRLRRIEPNSLQELPGLVSDLRMRRLLSEKIPPADDMAKLSPKLSCSLIRALAQNVQNSLALDVALATLPRQHGRSHLAWAQEDAIRTAIAAFGIPPSELASEVATRRDSQTLLLQRGAHVYEDNVIRSDASQVPGFDAVAADVTGRAVFEKHDERLVVYTANRLPLEEMLGVDLIYFNETRGNIVMLQYKMLEEVENDTGRKDWVFRPDKQLRKELERMKLPAVQSAAEDYRLNGNPFFFKFVKRKYTDDSQRAFIIAADHLEMLLESQEASGPRGGIRVGFEALEGTYLRESETIGLIRSGYIGTHRAESNDLVTLIEAASRGNRALVLAWQTRISAMDDTK